MCTTENDLIHWAVQIQCVIHLKLKFFFRVLKISEFTNIEVGKGNVYSNLIVIYKPKPNVFFVFVRLTFMNHAFFIYP